MTTLNRASPPGRALAVPMTTGIVPIVLALTLATTVLLGLVLRPAGGPSLPGAPGGTPVPSPSREPSDSPTPHPSRSARPTPTPRATPAPTPEPTPAPTVRPTPVLPPPATPVPTPSPAAPDYSRPGRIYLDILTAYRGYGDWYRSLLDTIFMLPADYYPADLVDSSAAGLNGGYPIRSFIVADLGAMAHAARAAGTPLAVVSGFRSHAQQQATFDYWVSVGGYQQALRTSARAGHSEHQLGTSLDFTSAGGAAPWEYADWATTPAGAWMAANAWRYGFVMSYPAGKYMETGYDYEPWHYRYVGRDMAAQIVSSGLTPREFLWGLQPQ